MCSCILWNVNPQVVRSTELVLHVRMSGVHNFTGCADESLATRGLQITGRDAARTVMREAMYVGVRSRKARNTSHIRMRYTHYIVKIH